MIFRRGIFYMNIPFKKYQGTGNDFILIDNRNHIFPIDQAESIVPKMCDRKFGIGSDGLVLVNNHAEYDYEMIFFNPDGSKSLCGNASRCTYAFAKIIGIASEKATFLTTDGVHEIKQVGENIHFQLRDIEKIDKINETDWYVNTGSPHYVKVVDDVNTVEIMSEGSTIRYSEPFQHQNGTNVNFIQLEEGKVEARTYERGVEAETLSCGTGVTAVGLVAGNLNYQSPVQVETKGGNLSVSFEKDGDSYKNIWLAGPAEFVFEGIYTIS